MRRRVLAVAVVLAAVVAWVLVARPRPLRALFPPRAPRHLLLISIDTLRADHLGAYGYAAAQTPRLDALAAGGLRFTRAATVVPLTLPAHSSLLTGTFPAWHGVRDNGGFYLGDDQVTLAETLKEKGYRTGGFVGSFVLDRRWGISQGFDRYFDEFDLQKFDQAASMDVIQRPGSEVVDQALKWLGEDRDRSFFAWVHLYDPHAPYDAPEPFRSRFPRNATGAYDAEIASADAQVGRLLDALDLDGRLAETLVVVVGDHGEMLGEHGEQTHGFFIYDAAVHIPLIISGPGVPAKAIPDQVRILDVMPTALSLLGLPIPKPVQGVSLMPLARDQRLDLIAHSESWYPRYHYGWSELQSVQDGRFKYIRAPRPELYDLGEDPGERRDRAPDDEPRTAAMDRALADLLARTTSASAAKGPQAIDSETEERLAALGYVGASVSPRHLEDRPRGDPKDKIALYNLLKQAGTSSVEGRPEEAIAKVQEALRADPEIIEGYTLLGNFYKKAKRDDDAIAAYRQALARDREHQGALFSLALAYKDRGRLEEARLGFERARALDPRNGKVLFQLVDIEMRKGDYAKAEEIAKDALARKVDEPRFQLKTGEIYIEARRYEDAEKALLRAAALKPDLDTVHFNLGLVYEEKGDPARAIASYEAEVAREREGLPRRLQPREAAPESRPERRGAPLVPSGGRAAARLRHGASLSRQGAPRRGRPPGAQQWAEKGLASKPDPKIAPLGHYVLADVYNRQGRTADAEREVKAARRKQGGG